MRFVLVGLLALAMSGPVAAQTWTPREDVNANLPESIRVFEDAAMGLFYARADLADTDWILDAVLDRTGQTVPSYASGDGVLLAINGGYFGGGQSFSLVQDHSTTLSPNIKALNRSGTTFYPTRGAFGLSPARQPDVAWIYDVDGTQVSYPDPSPNAPGNPQAQPTGSFPTGGAPWDIETGIGGGPVLVHDGVKRITYDEEVMFGSGVDLTSTRARTVIGYTADGAMLILSAKENPGLTLGNAADIMVGLGAVEAVNLDGGGSSQLTAGGVNLVTSSRPVVSAVLLRERSDDDGTVIDTGSEGYSEVGDWFESANAPFYGLTKSRLNEVGDGRDRATFVLPESALDATYVLSAWWVPASNRATNTPFIVYRFGASDTLRVDQTDPTTAGRWNELGLVSLIPGDSIVVSDNATGTTSPSFVSVDAIRLELTLPPSTEAGPTRQLDVTLSPNPTAGPVTATLRLRQPGAVRGTVVDLLGRTVRQFEARASAGEVRLEVPMDGLRAGVYLVRLVTPEGTATRPVTRL
ncbi:MAG: hypothetical protein Rubg2KO_23460 [Rubricoccaceae bacterium]